MRKRQLEDLVIAAGTHDLDGLIDVIVEITTPPPSVDMDRLRSQMDAWLNRYLLIEVGQFDMAGIITTGMRLLHDNGLVLPGRLVTALAGHVAAPGTRSGSTNGSPSDRAARALHEEVAGRTVRPEASRPPRRPDVSRRGTVWPVPCPATSTRSSSRSAPASSASTSASTTRTAPWIISSTASSRPLPCSRPHS